MGKTRHKCPDCTCAAFGCYRTMPVTVPEHELTAARLSFWRCEKCGAVYELFTPDGTLKRLRAGNTGGKHRSNKD